MKRILIASAVSVLLFSCKKTEDKKPAFPEVTGKNLIKTEKDFADEAKGRPLTTIALSEPGFDFGKIKKGAKVSHDYTITNTGDKPLVISAVRPGCGCTASEFTKEPILPGKTGKVTLSFDSSNFSGVVHKFAQVFANTQKTPITLTFTADIQH